MTQLVQLENRSTLALTKHRISPALMPTRYYDCCRGPGGCFCASTVVSSTSQMVARPPQLCLVESERGVAEPRILDRGSWVGRIARPFLVFSSAGDASFALEPELSL